MFRKTLLMLALAAAPSLAAQQPTQQPASVKPKSNASQSADTTKAKTRHKRARKAKPAATAAPRDTTKAKP